MVFYPTPPSLALGPFQDGYALGMISAEVVEGLNGKAKMTTRKAYGFRTQQGIEFALFHVMGPPARAEIHPHILLKRLREDESRNRILADNVAGLKRFAISLLKQVEDKESIAMRRRMAGWNPTYLLKVVEIPV